MKIYVKIIHQCQHSQPSSIIVMPFVPYTDHSFCRMGKQTKTRIKFRIKKLKMKNPKRKFHNFPWEENFTVYFYIFEWNEVYEWFMSTLRFMIDSQILYPTLFNLSVNKWLPMELIHFDCKPTILLWQKMEEIKLKQKVYQDTLYHQPFEKVEWDIFP